MKTPITFPQPRLPSTKRKPLTIWPRFLAQHQENERCRARYLASGRKGSVRLDRATLDELDPGAAILLHANNTDARIRFARIGSRHIGQIVDDRNGIRFFWVTLVPKNFVVDEGAAASFKPKRLQAWARQELRGLSYIGMVEAALYTNIGDVMAGVRRVIAWHVHVIVWGTTKAQLDQVLREINRRNEALLPGVEPAFGVPVTRQKVVGKALYMLKAPQSEYRVYPKRTERTDPATGEVTTPTTGQFKQKKRGLRPGDMIRMCKVMAGLRLDQLLFAGGEGVEALEGIRAAARQPLRDHERQWRAQEAKKRLPRPSSLGRRFRQPGWPA